MSAIKTTSDVLNSALLAAGLSEAFDERGHAFEDCPGCRAIGGLKLSLARGNVQCSACGSNGPLLAYLHQKAEAADWNHELFTEAETFPVPPRLVLVEGAGEDDTSPPASSKPQDQLGTEPDGKPQSTPPSDSEFEPTTNPQALLPSTTHSVALKAELVETANETAPVMLEAATTVPGRSGERIIMTLLALIFLAAGFAAAILSGFANYQAFRLGVSDPTQAGIWGWSGVIASVCSFGGFTFFWWHVSGHRRGEALRALVFALAGAGTSIAGTSLYMTNNADTQVSMWQSAETLRALTQSELDDWTRQLDGIPPETRSVAGLEAYLAGVEAAGRTHQKPYRDAQNELGQARRRVELEAKIAAGRETLRSAVAESETAQPANRIPAWAFALMLEVFSSQATSIAFVSLLLLYGRAPKRKPTSTSIAA